MKRIIITALLAATLVLGLSANAIAQDEASSSVPEHQVIAYYFHGTARCPTCKKIEAYTEEAVKAEFAQALEDGHLVWEPLNVEKNENQHFTSAYKLYSQSVVLSKRKDGEETDWKNLDRVWLLVGDKNAFTTYIQDETREMLGGQSQ